ncbi:hypothetical protein BDV98DRAFT_563645 [Pterulicium gracile]|uniref:Uncharacterized protein n=1 Tax=Pterulicium gracile TaxID=1884261 RepID=A0A5C3QUI7_9AGAR|nr:hypothetical protein BDV98DRAFT_563645 [Pterula gracilis]
MSVRRPSAPNPQIVALPSLSSSLSALPHAKSMSQCALHPNTFSNYAAHSEAKVSQPLHHSDPHRRPVGA